MRISDWSSDVCSSDLIASELNVTKGSFYHHLDAKDDLVIACYKRSFDTIAEAQRLADERGGTHWRRLSSIIATLLDVQFRSEEHTSELQSLMRISYAVFCLKKKKKK